MGIYYNLLLVVVLLACGALSDEDQKSHRQKRLFSIFNIVTFQNDVCTTTGTGNLQGTCLTSTECTAKGGSSSGNCAAGFGVCCLFSVSGACTSAQTISQNCTYIRNNGFPSADSTVSETCTYNFDRICDNLCQIRLDFDTLVTQNQATGACGDTADSVMVSSPFSSSANAFPPTVCGTLTGQHMYLETGNTGIAGELAITKGSDTGNRNFQIKVTYFTCNSLAKAPAGCTQYFTGKSGNFQSYNHQGAQLLQSMNYNNCFRQEEGYCNLQVREAAETTIDAFLLSAIADQAKIDCMTVSRITLASPISGSFCGDILSPIAADTIPSVITSSPGASFQVGVQSLAGDISGKTGFNLDYNQVPCA